MRQPLKGSMSQKYLKSVSYQKTQVFMWSKYKDYHRVITFADILHIVGKSLKKRGIRYTTVSLALTITLLMTKLVGNSVLGFRLPFTTKDALFIPLIAAVITFGVGQILISLANLFSSEKILSADANDMNLMEDKKKSEAIRHLDILWENVFKYESKLLYSVSSINKTEKEIENKREELRKNIFDWTPELHERLGFDIRRKGNLDTFIQYLECFKPYSKNMEQSKSAFIESACYALREPHSQLIQKQLVGFDFSLIEDWYDGALFTNSDNKLSEQYAANHAILAVRQTLGLPVFLKLRVFLKGHSKSMFFTSTMEKISMKVGQSIERMNEKYIPKTKPAFFKAQHFLWKEPLAEEIIGNLFGEKAVEELILFQKDLVKDIFSKTKAIIGRHIYNLFGEDFKHAFNLRLRYDIEFASGLLDTEPLEELKSVRALVLKKIYSDREIEEDIKEAQKNLLEADEFIDENFPEITPLQKRAARVGFYINRYSVRSKLHQETNPLSYLQKNAYRVEYYINSNFGSLASSKKRMERIIESEAKYTERIILLRQHYELTKLQIETYIKEIYKLAGL